MIKDAPASGQLFNQYTTDRFVIFLHIQKTAGMTVQRYLRKRFGPSFLRRAIWRLTGNARIKGSLTDAALARTPKDGFFAGHFCFGIHQYLPQPATYMVFLRDPISRVVSLYKHSRDVPEAFYHQHAKDASLHEFVTESGLMELDNGMVRFIAGSDEDPFINRAPVGTVDEAMLETAKANLDRFCFFVGLQEQFDASFLLLAKKFGDDAPKYLKLNEARKRSALAISDETIEAIKRSNRFDFELYDYAKQRLETELGKELPDLEQRLTQLEARNAAYASGYGPISLIRSKFR